ncbi:MAG: hypothetical protein JWN44_4560 [Myxococcales bacterium]|nr:hypothetical protein [Myxococcales bacterium]
MSSIATPGPEARAGIARWYTVIEDIVYVGLGLLLAAIVVLLLVSTAISFGRSAVGWSLAANIAGLLDQILLILLLVELLYTVQVSFREHALVPEPFLLVGLISVIRRVLVLTAVMGEKHEKGEVPTQPLVLELAVLAGLILALAFSLVLLRRRETPPTATRA